MRVIFINGKKLMVATILVVLMGVLVVLESHFHDSLKKAAWIQNNINSLEEYSIMEGKVNYKLPKEWDTMQKDMVESGVLYHNNFYDKNTKISGYIQLKEKKSELKDVIKYISEENEDNTKEKYNYQPVKVNSMEGYLITYCTKAYSESSDMKVYEYLVESEEVYVIVSFYVRKDDFKDNMPRIFNSITDTINVKKIETLN